MAGLVTLREASDASFRLVLKDGSYRDFLNGVLIVFDEDPAREELLAYAEAHGNITIIKDGVTQKKGSPVCPVCDKPVAAEDMAEHMAEVHVDEEGVREAAGLPPKEATAPRRRKRG